MIKLYHGTSSVCSIKVRLGIAKKGLNFDSQIISLPEGEQNTSKYLAINPFGVVPTLIHDDFNVFESSVINL
jgi:glutathione S-transferase